MVGLHSTQASFEQTSLDIIQTSSAEQDLTIWMKHFINAFVLLLETKQHCNTGKGSVQNISTPTLGHLISPRADCLISLTGCENEKHLGNKISEKRALKKTISVILFSNLAKKKKLKYIKSCFGNEWCRCFCPTALETQCTKSRQKCLWCENICYGGHIYY